MSRSTRLKGWVAKVLRTAQNTFHNISQLDSFGLCILRFLDHWRPPAYLIAEPNQEAADQIRSENIREQDMLSQWWSMMQQLISDISNPGCQSVACVSWNFGTLAFQCLSRVSMCQVFAPFQVWPLFEGMAHPSGQGWNLGRYGTTWDDGRGEYGTQRSYRRSYRRSCHSLVHFDPLGIDINWPSLPSQHCRTAPTFAIGTSSKMRPVKNWNYLWKWYKII